jgi:ELWxxDGT repeat protein
MAEGRNTALYLARDPLRGVSVHDTVEQATDRCRAAAGRRGKDIRTGRKGSNAWPLTAIGDALYFGAWDDEGSVGLWRSDGTAEGTAPVTGLEHGFQPYDLTMVGDTLYFGAYDRDGRWALWRSDGTPEGTALVKGFELGATGAPGPVGNLMAVGDTLYIPRVLGCDRGEPWSSDGTAAGTVRLLPV